MKTLIHLLPAVLLLILMLLEPAFAGGPPIQWQKTFGASNSDHGNSVQQTTDGGYIIAGCTTSEAMGFKDSYWIKIDSIGNKLWDKRFWGGAENCAYSVQQTPDEGYILTGYFGTGPSSLIHVIKTDSAGDIEWYAGSGGCSYSVRLTSDGGYIITGYTYPDDSGDVDVCLVKLGGYVEWEKTFGGGDDDIGRSVQQTSDGGYIIAGHTQSYGAGSGDVYLIKTDPNGNSQWQKTFGGGADDFAYSVQQTSDGGYIIAGLTYSYGAGSSDVYLIKTNPDGNDVWQRTFGENNYEDGYSVQQTSDDGYIVTGYTGSYGTTNGDVYLVKTDPNGISQWQKTIGGSNSDCAHSVQQTSDGGYIIAGGTESYGAGSGDVYLIKLCSDGTLSSDFNCNGTVYYEDLEILLAQWLQPPDILSADIYPELGDGIVNGLDFAALANVWLQSTIP